MRRKPRTMSGRRRTYNGMAQIIGGKPRERSVTESRREGSGVLSMEYSCSDLASWELLGTLARAVSEAEFSVAALLTFMAR